MEKILVFLDQDNKIESFLESKKAKLFVKKYDEWKVEEVIQIESSNFKSMNDIRTYFSELNKKIDDCKIVVTKRALGVAYNVFYGLDYSIWELDGEIEQHLDKIIEKELENIDTNEKTKEIYCKKITEDYWQVDLNNIQIQKPELSSKMIIRPVLKEKKFKRLDIICCHIPPWINGELDKDMIMNIDRRDSDKYLLTIYIEKNIKNNKN